jgi:LacI family transcriptional regulator
MMMVTIKKIAELCGVSRGTVDRVLNHRGRVKPKTEEAVWQMARQLGYQPNPAGKALAARKNHPKVGILVALGGNPFFDDVLHGIRDGAQAYQIYGLQVVERMMHNYDVGQQLALIEEMRPEINALLINPINDERIARKLDELVEDGIFVVTVNNDIENSRRQCYVGSDYFNGGLTAGALMQLLCGEKAEICVVLGSRTMLGHRERLAGFRERIKGLAGYHIAEVIENGDDEICSYKYMHKLLMDRPEVDAIFFAAAGVYGACRALEEVSSTRKFHAIAFDTVSSTVKMLQQGTLQALLYQHPYRQGHRAIETVFQYLVNGVSPQESQVIMKNDIKLIENL